MKNVKDNGNVRVKNDYLDMVLYSVIGDRTEQQDSFGYLSDASKLICVVADGMGGHRGGKIASGIAVDYMLKSFDLDEKNQWSEKSKRQIINADSEIYSLMDDFGNRLNAGSTIVSVYIDENKLYWASVGDSRAYLIRNGKYVQLTKDQNYGVVLEEKKQAGIISNEEYEAELKNKDGLINYAGIGNMKYVDQNGKPLELLSNDVVVLMSDGVYKIISERDILEIVSNCSNLIDTAQTIEMKMVSSARVNKIKRDNTTLALIKIR